MPREHFVSWMWPEACAMLARAERLHQQFFHVREVTVGQPAWAPPVDVLETRSHVVVMVALPGVDPGTVGAEMEEDALVIVGERSLPDVLKGAYIHRMELPQGRFERRVTLPRGKYAGVHTATADGCLVITLSKAF